MKARKSLRLMAVFAGAAMASACAGPLEPLEIGTKPIATDIALGRRIKALAETPLPPSTFSVGSRRSGLTFPVLEAPIREIIRRPRPAACRSATQAGPRAAANNSVLAPPKPGRYRYDVSGAELTGTNLTATKFPPESTHEVGNVQQSPVGTFTYDVTAELGGRRTVSTYRIVPLGVGVAAPSVITTADTLDDRTRAVNGLKPVDLPSIKDATGNPGDPATPVENGLYLAALQRPGSVVPARFKEAGVKLVGFPITIGSKFHSTASDGAVVFDYISTVGGKEVVNSCAALISAWRVSLEGTMSIPSENTVLPFTATYWIGPQYGGLIVQSKTRIGIIGGGTPGVDQGQPVLVRLFDDRVAEEPALLDTAS